MHARADASPPRYERLDGGRASGDLEDKGGLLTEEKETIREEKAIYF